MNTHSHDFVTVDMRGLKAALVALVRLPLRGGLGGVHLLRDAQPAAMTGAQQIRGADGDVDAAIVVTGCDRTAVTVTSRETPGDARLAGLNATEVRMATYRFDNAQASAKFGA
jgi:hypothetical protein